MKCKQQSSTSSLDILYLGKKDKKVRVAKAKKYDLIVCKGYPYTLPAKILKLPKFGCVNLHTSILPKYRGRHPIVWAMIHGEKKLGVSLHYMDEGIDTGDIIAQTSIDVPINKGYKQVKEILNVAGDVLLSCFIAALRSGVYVRSHKQKYGVIFPELFYMPRRTPKDSEIHFLSEHKVRQLIHFVKALGDPMPNAYIGKLRIKDIIVEEM